MKALSIIVVAALIIPSLASGGWIDKQGNSLPDQSDRKSIGDFGAHLILTDKEVEALKNWETPSETVNIPISDTIKTGKPITAMVVFSGCGVDKVGNCNLVGNYKILQPDGKIYADIRDQEVWINKPVPPNRNLGLSVSYIRIVIKPHEQLGKYVVQAKVIDKVRNQTLQLETSFQATK